MLEVIYKALLIFTTLLVFFIVGRFVGTFVTRLTNALGIDEFAEAIGIKFLISRTIGELLSIIFYLVGIYLALNELGITKVVALVGSAFIIFLFAIVVLLGLKDFVINFLHGFYKRKKYLKKNYLKIGNISGRIVDIGLTKIKIKTKEGEFLVVPFSILK